MKTRTTCLFSVGAAILLNGLAAPAQAQNEIPPLMKQNNDGNWMSDGDPQKLVDELYYQRAIHAYMTMLPALNTIAPPPSPTDRRMGTPGSEKRFPSNYSSAMSQAFRRSGSGVNCEPSGRSLNISDAFFIFCRI
jgi:hypothetical protein